MLKKVSRRIRLKSSAFIILTDKKVFGNIMIFGCVLENILYFYKYKGCTMSM